MDVDQRLDGIDQRLQLLEERLSRLEKSPGSEVLERESAPVSQGPEAGEETSLLALTGRSILILGGAFLLRAATESTAFPPRIGVVLGLLYAIVWIFAAARAARGRRRAAAVFHAAAAAIVAYPIVWEATTRFGVLSAGTAALLLVGFSVALIVVAHRYSLQIPAWIAVAGATMDALFLAYATKELIPFTLELVLVGVVAFLLSMSYVGWLLAIESDLFVIFLIGATLFDQSGAHRVRVVASLLVFAIGWMTVTRRASVQVALASLIGIGGASALALPASSTTLLYGFAAVVAAEIARQTSSRVFAVQSAAWGTLAAIGGGLFSFAAVVLMGDDRGTALPIPALVACALCLVAFARLDFARVPLLAIATCGAAAIVIHAVAATIGTGAVGMQALMRTGLLAAVAVGLAFIGRARNMPEASQLGVALLVLTGLKVVAQEFRTGSAVIMFVALAIYGSAMLAMARLRRVRTTS